MVPCTNQQYTLYIYYICVYGIHTSTVYQKAYVMQEKCGTADAGNMMAIKAKGGERLRGKMEKVL